MSLLHYLLETLFQFSSLLTLNCTSSSVVLLYLYTINSCCLLLILENNSFLESLNDFYTLPRFQDLIKNQEHYCVTRESLSARIFQICLKYLLVKMDPILFCQEGPIKEMSSQELLPYWACFLKRSIVFICNISWKKIIRLIFNEIRNLLLSCFINYNKMESLTEKSLKSSISSMSIKIFKVSSVGSIWLELSMDSWLVSFIIIHLNNCKSWKERS